MGVNTLTLGARMTLTMVGPGGVTLDVRTGHNMMTTLGKTAVARALMWAGAEDVTDVTGVLGPIYLAPLWGAVGGSTQAASPALTHLASELSRATVSSTGYTAASGSGSAAASFLFFMPGPATTWSITESALFSSAAAGAGTGTMLNYWTFGAPIVVTAPNSLVLQTDFEIG